jgi:hypothetical protein
MVVLGAFVVLLRRRVLPPLQWIFSASNGIRQGDLSTRAPVLRLDEIGRLAVFHRDRSRAEGGDKDRSVFRPGTRKQALLEVCAQLQGLRRKESRLWIRFRI